VPEDATAPLDVQLPGSSNKVVTVRPGSKVRRGKSAVDVPPQTAAPKTEKHSNENAPTERDAAAKKTPATATESESESSQLAEEATGLLGQAISSNLELAALYSELAEYKSLLEKKNRELVEVNQLISHDLKKPLTVFKTVIGLLHKGHLGELTKTQSEAIGNCAESIRYMEDLISDILESSRLDYDGVVFDFQDMDMTILVGTLVRRLRYHLQEMQVKMRVEPLPIIRGDQKALEKVFMNLIGNAINYRDPDKAQPHVRVSAEETDDEWVFRVVDNGIGIPADSLQTIWQKFARGRNTAGISGTGLGLYIVQQSVCGHGGSIDVESTVGEGTTFTIRLPKTPSQPAHSPVA
jgi:signal transduction histidine kinase